MRSFLVLGSTFFLSIAHGASTICGFVTKIESKGMQMGSAIVGDPVITFEGGVEAKLEKNIVDGLSLAQTAFLSRNTFCIETFFIPGSNNRAQSYSISK